MNLNNIRMGVKLPFAFVAFNLIVALSISFIGYRDYRQSLLDEKLATLELLTAERAEAIENWFDGMQIQLQNYTHNPTTVDAMKAFSSTFHLLMDDPATELHKAYVDDNPNTVGQKDLLDRAEATIPYNFQHEAFHPVYRAIKDQLELYDLFLIDLEGNVVYSVYKELDFATNLISGPYADSGLARAYTSARDGQQGATHFVDFAPYAPSAGIPSAFISSPIASPEGDILGVLAIQLPSNRISDIINQSRGLGETGEITLFGNDSRSRTMSRFSDRYEIFDPMPPIPLVTDSVAEGVMTAFETPNLNGVPSIGVARHVDVLGVDWRILGAFERTEILQSAVNQRNKTLIFVAVATVLVGLCGWLVSRTFSDPLTKVARAMQRISDRDYDAELPDMHRQDEIGSLSRALALVTDRLREFDDRLAREKEQAAEQKFAVDELGSGLQRLANQDFSQKLERTFAADYEALRTNFNDTVDRLGDTLSNLRRFATTLETQTEQIGQNSEDLSQRTENQASTLEETAAALDQITETIAQNSAELQSAERLIHETDGHVKQGRGVVESTTQAMDQIVSSSKEISSIIRVVDDIAFQTNLLALNAGVEAARAGDAGRGFAVVAAEVRQLAMRSTEAVSQIKALIDTSTANVDSGVALVRKTEAVLMEIVQRMEGISTVISSVSAGAGEQSGSITEINSGVTDLDRVTQQNALMVESSNGSVRALMREAANLTQILADFRLKDGAKDVVNIEAARFTSRRST